MRRAVDDITSTPTAYRLLAFAVLVVMVTIAASLPVVASAPSSVNTAHDGSPSSDGREIFYKMREITVEVRILYICDNTSTEFCLQPNSSRDRMAETSSCSTGLPPAAALPLGCTDMTSATGDGHLTNNSDTSTDRGREKQSTGSQEKFSGPSYLCWRLENGGLALERNLSKNTSGMLRAHVTYRTISGTLIDKMRSLDLLDVLNTTDVIVAVGDTVTVQVSALAGEWREVPVLGYITSYPDERKRTVDCSTDVIYILDFPTAVCNLRRLPSSCRYCEDNKMFSINIPQRLLDSK
ncbi:hypothetical protein RRG08_023499 [Elysia crispata]|uniref:Uncharacterized protein n=1 Tax=Elysia crispata TaxID=231223 RepID=A0AAE0YZ85_9GAST|nr:hypothetical protein RRG08_023499 [Elysia crispata]